MSPTAHTDATASPLQKAYKTAVKEEIARRLGVSEKKAAQIFSKLNRLAAQVDWATPVEKQSSARLDKKLRALSSRAAKKTTQRTLSGRVRRGR
jgi:DNA polymerase/3'-5' exonuclease PolX